MKLVEARVGMNPQILIHGLQGKHSRSAINLSRFAVFKYSSGLHSVVEFGSESDFKNCDISNPVNSMSSGNDVVKLNKAGTRYFACGTAGHCAQGMRVKITTVAGNAPSTPSSSSSSSSSPASTASAACASQGLAVSIMLIFAFFVVSLFGSY
ncbi:blue copper protein isoform X2 [Prosopis cineraria]|uniref:blue copper protein isoform X2 n=1 Tax=Prosopis cineraria TaxID=364024 RepID=UPI00240F8708|nr:blue copper protein isoform X2 [Prosopis cineraria]